MVGIYAIEADPPEVWSLQNGQADVLESQGRRDAGAAADRMHIPTYEVGGDAVVQRESMGSPSMEEERRAVRGGRDLVLLQQPEEYDNVGGSSWEQEDHKLQLEEGTRGTTPCSLLQLELVVLLLLSK